MKGGINIATTKGVDRELADRLYELLLLKKLNPQGVIGLDNAIARTHAAMTKEAIAWVEQLVDKIEV